MIRAKLEAVATSTGPQSFVCYRIAKPFFELFWHYHPEYELTYIISGSGRRLVGDCYEDFTEGDMVLLGPNLPHTWVSEKTKGNICQAIVVQFGERFVHTLLQFSEMEHLQKLFELSSRGIQIQSTDRILLAQKFIQFPNLNPQDAFIQLIQILIQVSSCKQKLLSSAHYKNAQGTESQLRINKVFQYVQKHFREEMRLPEVAAKLHLSETAFCKFFKRASGRTFSDYVNDIRIAHACRLLMESDKQISQVAYESGFESLTYFNRIFLKKKNIRPSAWRKISTISSVASKNA
jgi:AraC-like DNA-binding protein/mannose-6-phosphate isomerase-like protein (cupin superfamily)